MSFFALGKSKSSCGNDNRLVSVIKYGFTGEHMKIGKVAFFLACALFVSFSTQTAQALDWFGKGQKEKAKSQYRFREQNMAALKERLANNRSMADAQKTELVQCMEKQFTDDVNLREKRHEAAMLFFEQIANDPNMKQDQKKAAIQKHFTEQQVVGSGPPQEKKEARVEIKTVVKAVVQPMKPPAPMVEIKDEEVLPAQEKKVQAPPAKEEAKKEKKAQRHSKNFA